MLIQFFKKNSPSSFIFLPLFALLFWIIAFYSKQNTFLISGAPFYDIIVNKLQSFHFMAVLIAFLLVIAEAFLLNYIVNENGILAKPSMLPALFYIIFMSNDSTLLILHPIIFSNFFTLLAIHKLISSYQKDIAFSNAFDAGVLLSIASFFYFPNILLYPLLGIGLVYFRTFNWREWVISFFGVLLPFTFVFTYAYWNDSLANWVDLNIFHPIMVDQSKLSLSKSFYFMFSVILLIILFSFGKLFTGFLDASQKNKKGILFLIWFTVLALISLLIPTAPSICKYASLSIPVSVFCANYFLKIKKKWWGDLLFYLLLISIFINVYSG